MKLKLADIHADGCSKPACGQRILQRHHKGCERMWIKHFRRRHRSSRYKAFVERYNEFRKEDCVLLCEAHHIEIHQFYIPTIKTAVFANRDKDGKYKKMSEWTWEEAEELMQKLRIICDTWLQTRTPGQKRRKPMPWAPSRRKAL